MMTTEKVMKPIPLNLGEPPIDIARRFYRKWKSKIDFDDDLEDYLRTGIVIARPDIFMMAKIIEWKGSPAWFVRMAVGHLSTLVAELPAYFPWIVFCRTHKANASALRFDRFLQLTVGRNNNGQ